MLTREHVNVSKMSKPPIIDLMVVFFEGQGFYLSERQMKFCSFMLKHGNAVKAAQLAGFPEPKVNGPSLFSCYSDILHQWREHISFDFNLVRNIYTRQAQATKKRLVNTDAVAMKRDITITPVYEIVPDNSLQNTGAKGLRDLLGLDKSKTLDLNVNAKVGLKATTLEMLKNAYQPD